MSTLPSTPTVRVLVALPPLTVTVTELETVPVFVKVTIGEVVGDETETPLSNVTADPVALHVVLPVGAVSTLSVWLLLLSVIRAC
jgi:hypothetical protein